MKKTCTKCGITKPLDEFYNKKAAKDGKIARCKECQRDINDKYRQDHKEEATRYYQEHIDELRQKRGSISMHENKSCPQYLGVVIGERLCRHLFKDVETMPYGNRGYDIICNKGKKIDVKSGCITLDRGNPRWQFLIDRNVIADFFIFVAFDNRTNLNPLHLWMIPGSEINFKTKASISPSTIHKWNKWKRDINDVQLCCNEIKADQRGN